MSRRIVLIVSLVSLLFFADSSPAARADNIATITGVVVDGTTGDPVAGCAMTAFNDPIHPGSFQLAFTWETGPLGQFEIVTAYDGDFILELKCDGYFYEVYEDVEWWDVATRIPSRPGQKTELGAISLTAAPQLSMSVLDASWDSWRVRPSIDARAGAGYFFGNPLDQPFVGDWDCNGSITPGLYRPGDGFVYLRNSLTEGTADVSFYFGNPGDVPVPGDFNGDGCDTVSLYRQSEGRFFVMNSLGSDGGGLGTADDVFYFGDPGDKPFAGDFDGDGIDELGLHRETTGLVYYRNTLTEGVADHSFVYGDPGDLVFAGDWLGTGTDTVALYRPSDDSVYINFANEAAIADFVWRLTPGFRHPLAIQRRGVFAIDLQESG